MIKKVKDCTMPELANYCKSHFCKGSCEGCKLQHKDNEICKFKISAPCVVVEAIGEELIDVSEPPAYRPYCDTDEMVADFKERFHVNNVREHCMPLIWVKGKLSDTKYLITLFNNNCVYIDGWCDMNKLSRCYTYLDGSPCEKEITPAQKEVTL